MNTYIVTDKATQKEVYRYKSFEQIEWVDFPFSLYDHILEVIVEEANSSEPETKYLIDVGPFFDRFKDSKWAILTSADSFVKAIVQDTMVRKWVDLKRADVIQGIDMIAARVPEVTQEIRDSVLNDPVMPSENLALRKTFFGDKLNG